MIAFPRQIRVRVEDDNSEEGYACFSAFLIHASIAILRFGDFIELYKVQLVEGDAIYEMVAMLVSYECPNNSQLNFDEMVVDAAALTLGDFCNRYSEVFVCDSEILFSEFEKNP